MRTALTTVLKDQQKRAAADVDFAVEVQLLENVQQVSLLSHLLCQSVNKHSTISNKVTTTN